MESIQVQHQLLRDVSCTETVIVLLSVATPLAEDSDYQNEDVGSRSRVVFIRRPCSLS